MGQLYDPKRPRAAADADIVQVAATQHGLVTRKQALSFGLSPGAIKSRLTAGRWQPVRPSVYRVGGAPATWSQHIFGTCLWLGPDAVASHRTALALVLHAPGERPIHVTIPSSRHRPHSEGLVVHRTNRLLAPGDRTIVDGIPATSPARALLDVSATESREAVEDFLEALLRRRAITLQTVRKRLASANGLRGSSELRGLIDARSGGTESRFEARLLALIVAAGLPAPVQQYQVRIAGRLIARVDFAYPAQRVAIEADGFAFHDGRRAFDDERARGNDLLALGWDVLRVTWTHLHRRPASVIAWLRASLERRSVDGVPLDGT